MCWQIKSIIFNNYANFLRAREMHAEKSFPWEGEKWFEIGCFPGKLRPLAEVTKNTCVQAVVLVVLRSISVIQHLDVM